MVLVARRGIRGLVLASAGILVTLQCGTVGAEGQFNGLVGVTNDYLFRGRSQTSGEPAWQAGIGYEHSSGAFGGVWASRIDFSSRWDHELEVDYVVGVGRGLHRDWWGEISLRRYTYPRSPDPIGYDYTEIGGALRFRDRVTLSVAYSRDWTGYTSLGVVQNNQQIATEVGLQYPLGRGFSATGGLGWNDIAGPSGGTSWHWNAGVAHQYGRFTVDLSYYDTDSGARRLFGPASAQGDVVAGVVYSF